MNEAGTAILLAWFNKHKPVMEAFAKGEQVQYMDNEGVWKDTVNPAWYPFKYRIKPEPITRFAIITSDGKWADSYPSEDGAKRGLALLNAETKLGYPYRIVKMVEESLDDC